VQDGLSDLENYCGTTEIGFLSFDNQFTEAPEPSTFGLLGTTLAALGLMAFRRRVRTD
jgi:hypothetical protein